jgi:hypothetical protein
MRTTSGSRSCNLDNSFAAFFQSEVSIQMKHSVVSLLLCVQVFGQQVANKPKLSDSYGKAAFLALKAIERDNSQKGLSATDKAIAEADAEASSEEEKGMTKALNQISVAHELNNGSREVLYAKYMNEVAYSGRDPKTLSTDPELKAIGDREIPCFRRLEDALRSRDSELPDSCKLMIDPDSKAANSKAESKPK